MNSKIFSDSTSASQPLKHIQVVRNLTQTNPPLPSLFQSRVSDRTFPKSIHPVSAPRLNVSLASCQSVHQQSAQTPTTISGMRNYISVCFNLLIFALTRKHVCESSLQLTTSCELGIRRGSIEELAMAGRLYAYQMCCSQSSSECAYETARLHWLHT